MADSTHLYPEPLKRSLTRFDLGDNYYPLITRNRPYLSSYLSLQRALRRRDLQLMTVRPFHAPDRTGARDYPSNAETMIGLHRLDNLPEAITTVIAEGVPVDLLEAGE